MFLLYVRCDDIDIFTGDPKPPSESRPSLKHAQKMRAAITHKFGRDFGLGTDPWMEHPTVAGKCKGNPSLSVTLTQYMISLGRRKVTFVYSVKYCDISTYGGWSFTGASRGRCSDECSRCRRSYHENAILLQRRVPSTF